MFRHRVLHIELGLCTCLSTALSATSYTVFQLLVGTRTSHDQMFSMPCDVFIPAASSNTINETVAKQLNCKFVVEAANSPTTPAGDAILREKGIIVCPDIYASGGGVAVSWLEWVQNLQNFRYGSAAGFLKKITTYSRLCRTYTAVTNCCGTYTTEGSKYLKLQHVDAW